MPVLPLHKHHPIDLPREWIGWFLCNVNTANTKHCLFIYIFDLSEDILHHYPKVNLARLIS